MLNFRLQILRNIFLKNSETDRNVNNLDFVLMLCVNKMATVVCGVSESWRQLGQLGDGGRLCQPHPDRVHQQTGASGAVRPSADSGAEVARDGGPGERALDRQADTQLTPGTQPWPARSSTPSTISL